MSNNAFQIVAHINGGNSQGLYASLGTPEIPPLISPRIFANRMREAVDFNGKSRFEAKEVERVGSEGVLPAELEPAWSIAKHIP